LPPKSLKFWVHFS